MQISVAYDTPLFWAIMIGWILSVTLHEFAHGLVASLGGDYTIRERGGLTLNPLQYIHPVTSIIMPAIFLLMGGIPLPGAATFIRTDLLRSKWWETAVALAGPATNILLFVAFALPLHPAFGWIDPTQGPDQWTPSQMFCGAMAVLQMLAALYNLVPIPPLDGFQAVAPHLDEPLRIRLSIPPTSTVLFFIYFLAIWRIPKLQEAMFKIIFWLLNAMHFGPNVEVFGRSFAYAIWGVQ